MAKTVVVFDFDKTIIDCDSDNWVVDELGVNELFSQLLPTMPWNHLMDRMMVELHSRGKTKQDIAECLKKIELHPMIITAIKSFHASRCDLRIVSDANDFFIETIMKHHGLMDCFSEIITNPSHVGEGDRFRILQYHDSKSSSHGCTICPPNMCKGLVMDKIRASACAEGRKRFVYVGDGTPDFCAGLKLVEGDLLMPRKNFPLWELICNNKKLIKAHVQEWGDAEELGTMLLNLMNTIFTEENSSLTPDPRVPVDCNCQTSPISPATSDRNALQVPQ